VDKEAKVRAHTIVLNGSTSINKALKAMTPRLVIRGYLSLVERVAVIHAIGEILLHEIALRIIRQEYTNNTMTSLTEGRKITCTVKVFTDKFRPCMQCWFKPSLSFRVYIDMLVICSCHTWTAVMVIRRKESMNPQLVVDI
jgi:hypothetical protein